MKAKRIEVVKNWPEPKSVRNIQIFFDFANFYWQFIQGFSKIAAPLTSMLKTNRSPDRPVFSRNNGSRPASNRNNGSKPAFSRNNSSRLVFGKNDGDNEFDRFGDNSVEHAKKSGKSKGQNLAKFQKSKSEKSKKRSKSGNSPNFDAMEAGSSFLTPEARAAFNCLRRTFTEALILWYFDLEYYIWIKIDASGYAISSVLSQLAFGTRPDRIVTKTDLGQ